MRLFVAVRLPEHVRAALGAEIERLRRLARGVAWVPAENLHVTLKFLGETAPERLDAVRTALGGVAGGAAAFDLAVRGLGAFPTPTRPRVLWAGLGAGGDALAVLAGAVDGALAAAGFAAERRPYTGHVTLGRVREPRVDPRLAQAIAEAAGRSFGHLRVERLSLMRSELHPRGARYTEVDGWPLQGSREKVPGPG